MTSKFQLYAGVSIHHSVQPATRCDTLKSLEMSAQHAKVFRHSQVNSPLVVMWAHKLIIETEVTHNMQTCYCMYDDLKL